MGLQELTIFLSDSTQHENATDSEKVKWDAADHFDSEDHTEIFGPDARPRPPGKTRPAKKTKSETTQSSAGSGSGSMKDVLNEELRQKIQAGKSAYEAKKLRNSRQRSLNELQFLTYLTPRDITREGFHLQNCMADLLSNGEWIWPQSWLLKAPDLGLVSVPSLEDARQDVSQCGGSMVSCGLVFSLYSLARFSFMARMRHSLKTQDKLRQWDVGMAFRSFSCRYGAGSAPYA
ncbi:hypothetical protein Tco_0712865 [Tanacetum coccineum]